MDQDRKDGSRLIKLTQGQFAIVDDEDFERLNAFKWHAALDAALAYDRAAIEHRDEFACTNRMLGLLPNVDLSEKVVAREQQMTHHSLVSNEPIPTV